jgi:hypothetical protein
MKRILTDSQQKAVESILSRLDNSLTSINVRNWLENFNPKDWDNALLVLSMCEYYSSNRILFEFDNNLKKCLTIIDKLIKRESISNIISYLQHNNKRFLKANNNNIVVHAIGDYAKSGTSMMYYFKKTQEYFNNKKRLDIAINIEDIAVS